MEKIEIKKIQNKLLLKDKIALVTGATGHLGRQIAIGLASYGAHVLVNSRSKDKAAEIKNIITNEGFSATEAIFDITKTDEIKKFFSNYKNKINVLINNAYQGTKAGRIETSSDLDYEKSYKTSVIASHNVLTSSLTSLRKAVSADGEASVVNISSMYGLVSPDPSIYTSIDDINPSFYGSAKAAQIQFTKYAAIEFGKENIRVNSITPGPFPSYEVQKKDPGLIKNLNKKVPLGRIGSPEEIIGPIIFLSSSASSYVNGANITVDGGWTAW